MKLVKTATLSAGALLLCSSAQAQSLFFDGFETSLPSATNAVPLEGAATGTGIFAEPWQVQNDDSSIPGYNIVNATSLTRESGNYAIGGDSYQGSARTLDRAAAVAIAPGLANLSGTTEVIGGGGLTLEFSGVIRRDAGQRPIPVNLGTNFFGGATSGSANTGFGFGDEDENGFIDVFSRGTTFNSPIALTLGMSYNVTVRAVFAETGTAAALTLFVDGVQVGALATLNGTFREVGFYGGNGVNSSSVDNLSLSVVPEPSSIALGALGVLGLVARRRRS